MYGVRGDQGKIIPIESSDVYSGNWPCSCRRRGYYMGTHTDYKCTRCFQVAIDTRNIFTSVTNLSRLQHECIPFEQVSGNDLHFFDGAKRFGDLDCIRYLYYTSAARGWRRGWRLGRGPYILRRRRGGWTSSSDNKSRDFWWCVSLQCRCRGSWLISSGEPLDLWCCWWDHIF